MASVNKGDLILVDTEKNKACLMVRKVRASRIFFNTIRDEKNAFNNYSHIKKSWLKGKNIKHIKSDKWDFKNTNEENIVIYKD